MLMPEWAFPMQADRVVLMVELFSCTVFFKAMVGYLSALQWRPNGSDSVSNQQSQYFLLNRLFRRRWKETSKPRVTGLCAGNSPGTGELCSHYVSIWWRHRAAEPLARLSHVLLPIAWAASHFILMCYHFTTNNQYTVCIHAVLYLQYVVQKNL